ncbi:unnamed protein product [Amoebophrya sp. A25]|nr:unnamed protein product [Amoebophrya sp. A25]|eukprot:GSA25T00011647001.1
MLELHDGNKSGGWSSFPGSFGKKWYETTMTKLIAGWGLAIMSKHRS